MHPISRSYSPYTGASFALGRALRASLVGSVAVGLITASCGARAIGLGEIVLRSGIGESFKAEIPLKLSAGEQADVSCIKLAMQPSSDLSDIPWLSRGRLSIQQTDKGLVLQISGALVNHPAIMLGVQISCGVSLRRDYALLLDPPREALSPVVVAAAPTPRSSTASPDSPRQPSAARDKSSWIVEQGESLAAIAQALYPDQPARQKRFIRRAFRSGLLPSGYISAEAPLPDGSRIAVADIEARTKTSPPRTEAIQEAQPRPDKPERKRERAPKTGEPRDRLFISEGGESVLRLTTSIADRPELSANEREKLKTELQLIAALDEKNAQHIELKERIKQLENLRARLLDEAARLETDLAASQSQTAVLAASSESVSPVAASSALVVATPAPPVEAAASRPAGVATTPDESAWRSSIYMLTGALLAAAALLAAGVVFFHRKRDADSLSTETLTDGTEPDPVSPPPLEGDPLMEPLSEADIWPEAAESPSPATVKAIEGAIGPLSGAAPSSIMYTEGEDEHDSAVELADIMMSFGRMQGAAQTLSDFIRANPKQAVKPWVKLLEVYRTANMRMEFEALTAQMHKTFNVQPVQWEDFEVAFHAAESLENMAHISQRLCDLWGKRECQAYLHELLRDNRQGTRQGFPLAIVDEVLLLMAILDAQLGPYKPGATNEAPAASVAVEEEVPTIPRLPETRTPAIAPLAVTPPTQATGTESNSLDFDLIDMDMLTKTLHINLDELTEPPPSEDRRK